jgi:hypothetical protein
MVRRFSICETRLSFERYFSGHDTGQRNIFRLDKTPKFMGVIRSIDTITHKNIATDGAACSVKHALLILNLRNFNELE